jgi:hypothetical protein
MRRPGVFRDDGARHRPGALGRGQIARPFPRRFDEFFGPEQIVEVDLPGLTSPMLGRFTWSRLPRPVIPLDENVEWRPPA